MVDFNSLLDRKYSNLEANTASESALRQAQATGITGALGSENALRNAQAFTTREQGATLGPLAQASIASTNAGIPVQGAQAGLLGAQTNNLSFDLAPAHPLARLNYYNQTNTNSNFGLNAGQPLDNFGDGSQQGNLYSAGTSMVPGKGAKGKGAVNTPQMGPANGTKAAAGTPTQPMVAPPMGGGMTLHDVMHHAMGALHAAGGATDVPAPPVPAPGQTVTNGTWGAPTPNQDLRKQMGMGVKAAGGATTVMPVPTPMPPAPGQTITNGTWGAPTPNQDLRAKMGYGVKAAGGATSVNAKGGTAAVPGKGAPNVDSVPATLAPREAVLNAGAADHMGRGAIAALNALGAAKMAAQGMPPAMPPTAHGTMGPMAKPGAAKPMGRGMPKPPPGMAKGPAKPAAKAVAAKPGRK